MRSIILVAGLILSLEAWLYAADNIAPVVETKALMAQYLMHLTSLKRYLISDEKFSDPKNAKEIETNLKEFARLAKSAAHDPTLNQENFKFSRQVLEQSIVESERAFRLGRKSYARWQLNSAVNVCMSCHTQLPSSNRVFTNFKDPSIFTSKFDRAEFLFATRVFDRSMDLYDESIKGFPDNQISIFQIETALERQVAYFTRIIRNPAAGILKLKEHQKNKLLPEFLQNNIKVWMAQLSVEEKQTPFDPRSATDKQIIEYAAKNIESDSKQNTFDATNPRLVTYLVVSGMLFEFLEKHPQSAVTPQVLYWLAMCERSIENNFFFSLSDLYLRECVTKYPADPIAKKCYNQYELEITLGYTGSGGTRVPLEVKQDLEALKQLVDSKGKVDILKH